MQQNNNQATNFIEETGIEGLVLLNPRIFGDKRGYFFEIFNEEKLRSYGHDYHFVQDNQAGSSYGVLRGLHFQQPPYTQAKLVQIAQGKVLDVVVDLRKQSATYRQSYSVILSEENRKQLLIPRGFAHGYVVLSDYADFVYKCDNFYSKDSESGIAYNDPSLNIDWQIPVEEMIISNKDTEWKTIEETPHDF